MVLILILAMIGVPILEIVVFIEAGGYLGLWPTVGAVILTAIVGSALLRHQGLSTLARAQENLAAGRLPMTEVFDGLCILVGGALLLTPGFITDGFGFLLLVPPFRAGFLRVAGRYLANKAEVNVWTDMPPPAPDDDHVPPPPPPPGGGPVIDGEFEEVEPGDRDAESGRDNPRRSRGPSDGSSNPWRGRRPPTVVPPEDP
jgi:UPF0716 protein FxsA